jgi:hypothetical protein
MTPKPRVRGYSMIYNKGVEEESSGFFENPVNLD